MNDNQFLGGGDARGQSSHASPTLKYLETLCRYYEEEVEGEGYFYAIAERMDNQEHRRKMELIAAVETAAAAYVWPLVEKYDLKPKAYDDLLRAGRAQAEGVDADWQYQTAQMLETFPGYINDFLELEAMAPAEDLVALKLLTEHETAAIDFLEREAAGDNNSTDPLLGYLSRASESFG